MHIFYNAGKIIAQCFQLAGNAPEFMVSVKSGATLGVRQGHQKQHLPS